MASCSTLFYRTSDGVAESLEIPTIQSLDVPDSSCIPSRPTVTGEYRNQFVSESPRRVCFVAWLEKERYGADSEEMDVAGIIDKLNYLKAQRIKFNLTTTHEAEESRFLSDLIIESISYCRDANRRNRLVITVNCVKIKLIDLTWKQANAIEIFGQNIFTTDNLDSTRLDFVPFSTDSYFQLSLTGWQKLKNFSSNFVEDVGNIYKLNGAREESVALQIREQIESKVSLTEDSLFFKLATPIDLSTGSRNYNCKCSFQTGYGLGTSVSNEKYTMNVLDLTVQTKQKEVSLTGSINLDFFSRLNILDWADFLTIPVATFSALLKEWHGNPYDELDNTITGAVYDFADTYPQYPLSKTFEHYENVDDFAKYMHDQIKEKNISDDKNSISNGKIIIIGNKIYAYGIPARYDYTVKIGDTFTKTIVPDCGLRVDVVQLTTTANGFKPIASATKCQDYWDNMFKSGSTVNYSIHVVFINLGTLVQIYLFSPRLFADKNITYNE